MPPKRIISKKNTYMVIFILLIFIAFGIFYQSLLPARSRLIANPHSRVERFYTEKIPLPAGVSAGEPVVTKVTVTAPPMATVSGIERSPKEINAIDRFWNPLRYPMRDDYFYEQNWYPELSIPFQVIGGGARNGPTLGGTQVPISNPNQPLIVSNSNIAPVNITTRGPRGQPQQVGIIYKLNASPNEYLPLFGMKEYPNSSHYLYYTVMGHNSNIKVPVFGNRRHDELGNNDLVHVQGQSEPYRVSIYESNFPQYVPYL